MAASAALAVTGLTGITATSAAADDHQPWMDTSLSPDERADLLADVMTLDQKLTLFAGSGAGARPIPELGIPARREIDGAGGVVVRDVPGGVTGFPAPYALAATWSEELARGFGQQASLEARLAGFSGWAGPAADLTRTPYFGRQYASYGEDPLLAGRMPAAVVEGVNENEGVYALPKHYVGNNQETQRVRYDALIDERTLREVYVRQWEPLVAAGPGAIMCAFPQVNGAFACENPNLLWDILKGELGYPGWVSSDFNACKTLEAYNLGTDVCGPNFPTEAEFRQAVEDGTIAPQRFDDMVHRILRTYFDRGLIDNPPPGSLEPFRSTPDALPAELVEQGRELAYQIAVQGSVLLRNQDDALPLDSAELDSIAVIGEGADRYITGFGSDIVTTPTQVTTIVDGIRARAGDGVEVTETEGFDPVRVGDLLPGDEPIPSSVLSPASGEGAGLTAQWFLNPGLAGDPFLQRVEDQVNWGQALAGLFGAFGYDPSPSPKLPIPLLANPAPSARWTGTLNPTVSGTYRLGLSVLGQGRLWLDGALVVDVNADTLQTPAVEVELQAGESYEVRLEYVADAPGQCCATQGGRIGPAVRLSWTPPADVATPQIQEAVAAAEAADVAVVVANDYLGESLDRGHLGLIQNQDPLIRAVAAANPNTVVVLATGAPVEMPWLEDVAAVAETWYPGQEQGRAVAALLFGDENFAGNLPVTWPASEGQVNEGLGLQNPFFDVNADDLTITYDEGVNVGYRGYEELDLDPLFPFGYGLSYTGFEYSDLVVTDPRARAEGSAPAESGTVEVSVTNTGDVAGEQTVQVYHGELPTDRAQTPERQLLGWANVTVEPGATERVTIPVELYTPEHRLAYWDAEWDYWITPTGQTELYVGASVRDVRIEDTIEVREPAPLDTTAPTFELPGLTDGGIYGNAGTIEWGFTIDDPDATVTATLDGAAIDLAQPLSLWALDLGQHELVVTATDQAGNATSRTFRFYLKTSFRDIDMLLVDFETAELLDARDAVALRNVLFRVRAQEARGNDRAALVQLANFRRQVERRVDDEAAEAALLRSTDAMVVELGGTPPGAQAQDRTALRDLGVADRIEARQLLRD